MINNNIIFQPPIPGAVFAIRPLGLKGGANRTLEKPTGSKTEVKFNGNRSQYQLQRQQLLQVGGMPTSTMEHWHHLMSSMAAALSGRKVVGQWSRTNDRMLM